MVGGGEGGVELKAGSVAPGGVTGVDAEGILAGGPGVGLLGHIEGGAVGLVGAQLIVGPFAGTRLSP